MNLSIALLPAEVVVLATLTGARLRPRPVTRPAATPSRRRWPWVIVVGAAVGIAPRLGLTVTMVVVISLRWSRARRSTRAHRRLTTDFPDALDLLVLSIRAGYLPAQAIVEIEPFLAPSLRPAFGAVGDAMRGGSRFADALDELRAHIGPVAQALVDSLSAADRYGLPLAPVLERLSFEVRQQRRRDTDAAARELPVRLAMPLVLCTLPSFVLLAIVPLLLGALSSLHT
ncbi:MAG: type II secretion system F family protein [Ilumatobacteraceae bacterium]